MRPARLTDPIPSRTSSRKSRPRAASLTVESLEARTMLSTTALAEGAISPSVTQDNRAYVERLMGNDRSGTPQEAALGERLIARLERGVSREQVVLQLLRSMPSSIVQARNTFSALLGRAPRPDELRAGVARLRQFGDDRGLMVRLVSTREFYATRAGGSAEGFLEALYGVVVRRTPTAAEQEEGLRALSGPASRSVLARQLLRTPEARAIQIRIAHQSSGAAVLDGSAQDLAKLARPGGLLRVTARALAADAAFHRIVNPPAVRPPARGEESSLANQPPGYPVADGFNLNSSVQPLSLTSLYLEGQFNAMSAGSDDVLWIAGDVGLSTYDLNSGVLTQVYTSQTRLISVAALDATEVYAVPDQSSAIVHVVVSGGIGTGTSLPSLPGGDLAAQVAASPDGTVWVIGQSGNVYAYASASQTWTAIATGGNVLEQVSIGSAANIWAVTKAGAVLQYSAATGFQPDPFFAGSAVGSIQATADGAVWAEAKGFLFLKPSYGVWLLAPRAAQPTALSSVPGFAVPYFAAGSMSRAYLLGTTSTTKPFDNLEIDLINFGVVDRQAIPFPSYQGDELAAYQAISLAATVDFNNNIRSLYNQLGESWSSFLANINGVKTPPTGFNAQAWNTVWNELHTELTEVSAVAARLDAIQTTNTQLQILNSGQLNAVGQIAGLIVNNTPSESLVDVVLTDLFEGVLGAISSTGIGAGYATLAALLSAGFTDAIAAFQQSHNAGPNDAVPIKFSQLQTQLDTIFSASITAINNDLASIATDRGKLADVAGKILSNAWPFPDTDNIVSPATFAYDVYFYQSLIASEWQVEHMLWGDYIKYPITQVLNRVPTYAIAQYAHGYQDGVPVADVYLINQIGSTTNWDSTAIEDGPFPTSILIAGVQGLGDATTFDFWSGQGDWSVIKRLEATL